MGGVEQNEAEEAEEESRGKRNSVDNINEITELCLVYILSVNLLIFLLAFIYGTRPRTGSSLSMYERFYMWSGKYCVIFPLFLGLPMPANRMVKMEVKV